MREHADHQVEDVQGRGEVQAQEAPGRGRVIPDHEADDGQHEEGHTDATDDQPALAPRRHETHVAEDRQEADVECVARPGQVQDEAADVAPAAGAGGPALPAASPPTPTTRKTSAQS